jgi:hypothetical protein
MLTKICRRFWPRFRRTQTETPPKRRYSKQTASELLATVFDKDEILKKRLPYEHLDQLTADLLAGGEIDQ